MNSPGTISREDFDQALGRYAALINSISTAKTSSKEGQDQTLAQLDKYRFEDAPSRYYNKKALDDPEAAPMPMSHADVVQLVKWKLKHGTFRPNLLKLVESNSFSDIRETTLDAFTTYKKNNFNPTSAITKLTSLRGIGPATASLLMSVHDAACVPFFSDELYQWLSHDGAKAIIKYNMKEYSDLLAEAGKLIARLEVDARDVEKVAFVLIKEAREDNTVEKEKKKTTSKANGTTIPKKAAAPPNESKPRSSESRPPREPKPPREPTDMTEERKAQLVETAEKARLARMAKREAKLAKGSKFRERIDAARDKKSVDGPTASMKEDEPTAGVKRKSAAAAKESPAVAKRSRKGNSN